MPEADECIFKLIENPLAFKYLYMTALHRLNIYVKNPEETHLFIYITGLKSALIAALQAAAWLNVAKVTLMHWD